MSPFVEFLIINVVTRSLLMSFVKDNYGLGGIAREWWKACFVEFRWMLQENQCFFFSSLKLSIWPVHFINNKSRPAFNCHCGALICFSTFGLFIHDPDLIDPTASGWSMAHSGSCNAIPGALLLWKTLFFKFLVSLLRPGIVTGYIYCSNKYCFDWIVLPETYFFALSKLRTEHLLVLILVAIST